MAEHWKTAASLGTIEGGLAKVAPALRGERPRGRRGVADFGARERTSSVSISAQILFKEMDEVAPAGVVLASSSSGILISEIQTACAHPERVVIGHPFNPPHLIPLVEVVGGKLTGASAIETALEFYGAIGKHPIHIKREVKGHVANRLQAALWREAFGLVQNGVASVADIDAAISHGPGLRWALLGPFLNLHLSGGAGGMQHMLDHLGPPIHDWWADLYSPTITDEIKREIVAGSAEQTAGWDMKTVQRERDEVLIDLLVEKSKAKHLP